MCEDIADGRIDAAGDIGNDDDRLAGGGAHDGAGHVRELLHLFGAMLPGMSCETMSVSTSSSAARMPELAG